MNGMEWNGDDEMAWRSSVDLGFFKNHNAYCTWSSSGLDQAWLRCIWWIIMMTPVLTTNVSTDVMNRSQDDLDAAR